MLFDRDEVEEYKRLGLGHPYQYYTFFDKLGLLGIIFFLILAAVYVIACIGYFYHEFKKPIDMVFNVIKYIVGAIYVIVKTVLPLLIIYGAYVLAKRKGIFYTILVAAGLILGRETLAFGWYKFQKDFIVQYEEPLKEGFFRTRSLTAKYTRKTVDFRNACVIYTQLERKDRKDFLKYRFYKEYFPWKAKKNNSPKYDMALKNKNNE